MSGFVKLYGTILTSSVWVESTSTRIVWITLLALADKDGFVSAAVPGLAHVANVSLADCEAALRVLESPDAHSRTPEHDGRRIERIEGGWLVLNRTKYRDIQTEKQRADAERQRQYRDSHPKRDASQMSQGRSPIVQSTETEKTQKQVREEYPPEFEMLWAVLPKKAGANKKQTYRLYVGHLKSGIDYDVMYQGGLRYLAYATAKAWLGTDWVKAPQVFMGRDKHFLLEWSCADIPVNKSPANQDERRAAHYKKMGYVT